LSEERLYVFTSLNWENLIELREMMTSMRNSYKTNTVIKSFEKDILLLHFGFTVFSREELIENQTSTIAKKLYNLNSKLALIFDGTYVHHQKSLNHEYQRRSYSGQNRKPLCKPFTITTTNGYIVETLRPYSANKNDAEIMKQVLKDPNGLKSILREGDICIVDRDFRDVKDDLIIMQGYTILMSALKGKRRQLTIIESNESRRVTKIRWVIEAIHGSIGK
ncbi:hypothetical protein ALC62_02071, partial [Cyphomyrmex costatus]